MLALKTTSSGRLWKPIKMPTVLWRWAQEETLKRISPRLWCLEMILLIVMDPSLVVEPEASRAKSLDYPTTWYATIASYHLDKKFRQRKRFTSALTLSLLLLCPVRIQWLQEKLAGVPAKTEVTVVMENVFAVMDSKDNSVKKPKKESQQSCCGSLSSHLCFCRPLPSSTRAKFLPNLQ